MPTLVPEQVVDLTSIQNHTEAAHETTSKKNAIQLHSSYKIITAHLLFFLVKHSPLLWAAVDLSKTSALWSAIVSLTAVMNFALGYL